MAELAGVRVIVVGRVQGVFFRAFASRHANELGLSGYAKNLPDGNSVEVQAEGHRDKLEKLIAFLKVGPPGAVVDKVETTWSDYTGQLSGFTISYN